MAAPYDLVALGILGLSLSAGCAKLNPAFQEGRTGSEKDSAGGTFGERGTGGASGGTVDSASGGATTLESDSDHSSTKPATGSDTGNDSRSDSGTTGAAESGETRPPWTDECEFFQPVGPCESVVASDQGFSCALGFAAAFEPGCDADFVSTVPVLLDEGTYVLGAIGIPEAEYAAFQSKSEVLDCSPDNPVFEVDAGVQVVVELEVWNPLPTVFPLWLRRVDSLCAVADNCCAPSGAAANVACDSEGLRECVLAADPPCLESWDFICTDVAMFECGANCT